MAKKRFKIYDFKGRIVNHSRPYGEWVFGNLYEGYMKNVRQTRYYLRMDWGDDVEVDYNTVVLYTGFTDQHNRGIYDKDIVLFKMDDGNMYVGFVHIDPSSNVFVATLRAKHILQEEYTIALEVLMRRCLTAEIIGNQSEECNPFTQRMINSCLK